MSKGLIAKNSIIESLREVLDPEIGINIVDLNMVRDVTIVDDHVKVTIALTVPHCPMAKTLQSDVENALKKLGSVKSISVETTAMSKTELNELRTRLQSKTAQTRPTNTASVGSGIERLGKRNIRNIIAVASGKGGVGKSFVTGMLACQLRRQGYEVGILDADLTGPSIAKIFGLNDRPTKTQAGNITPVQTKTGIKVMSINLVLDDPGMPVIWRGPIVNSVIRQLYWDVDWGPLHYLLVDLPPGCVTADTMVYANPHPVRIDEIKPGDHVYSLDAYVSRSGRYPNVMNAKIVPKLVLNVVPQGEAEVFELRTKSRRIRGTYNHPVLALEKTRTEGRRAHKLSLKWKRLTELRRGDIIAVAKKLPETEADPFQSSRILPEGAGYPPLPSLATEDFCRIIGYFIGDGFLRITPRTRTYQLMFAEPRLGRFRRKYIELLKGVFPGLKIYEDVNQFGILSRRITLLFKELGLGESALNKRVPHWVFRLSPSKKMAFIEGYCDADGYRRPAKAKYRRPGWMVFESPNRWLLEDLRVVAISLGLRVTNLNSRQRTLRPPSGRTYMSTYWSFEGTPTTRSNRYGAGLIRGRGRETVGRGLVNEYIGFERVSNLTHVGRSQVYDLEVEGNQNFLAEGLVIHNTSDAPLTVFQSLPLDGVVIVSSPQELASLIVTKAVNMAKKMNTELLGLVENMSSMECPKCGEVLNVYGEPQGEKLAKNLGIQFLGSIPLDPMIATKSDRGLIEEYNAPVFQTITDQLRMKTSQQVQQLTQGLPIAWSLEPSTAGT